MIERTSGIVKTVTDDVAPLGRYGGQPLNLIRVNTFTVSGGVLKVNMPRR